VGLTPDMNVMNLLAEEPQKWCSALSALRGVRQLRGLTPSGTEDWAGVTGLWHGAYAFMK
jgi:hypothetical protein